MITFNNQSDKRNKNNKNKKLKNLKHKTKFHQPK